MDPKARQEWRQGYFPRRHEAIDPQSRFASGADRRCAAATNAAIDATRQLERTAMRDLNNQLAADGPHTGA